MRQVRVLHASLLRVAWVPLDDDDNDPVRFWRYMIAAQPDPVKTILIALINELAASTQQAILAPDDYQIISNREIHCGEAPKELR